MDNNRKDYGTIKFRSWGEVCEQGLHKQNISQRVDAMTLIKPFIIKECDLLTIKRIVNYSRVNSKGDWGLALKMLLDAAEADAKTTLLYEKIINLESMFNAFVGKPEKVEEDPKAKKTFGGEWDVKTK